MSKWFWKREVAFQINSFYCFFWLFLTVMGDCTPSRMKHAITHKFFLKRFYSVCNSTYLADKDKYFINYSD